MTSNNIVSTKFVLLLNAKLSLIPKISYIYLDKIFECLNALYYRMKGVYTKLD